MTDTELGYFAGGSVLREILAWVAAVVMIALVIRGQMKNYPPKERDDD